MDKAAVGEREGGVSTAVPTVEILYFDSLGHRGTAHCNNLIRYHLRQINIEIAFSKNIEMTGFYHTILKFPDT